MATKIKAGSSIREVLASQMLRAPVFKRRLMRELRQNGDSVTGARAAVMRKLDTHADLLAACEQLLDYIEQSEANRGKATSAEQWAENVAEFRRTVTRVDTGRSYVPSAVADLAAARAAIDKARTKPTPTGAN